MITIASQITSLTIDYSSVYSGADQRKHQSSASLAFVRGIPGEFPAQMASNAENVSIWWRHHEDNSSLRRPRSLIRIVNYVYQRLYIWLHYRPTIKTYLWYQTSLKLEIIYLFWSYIERTCVLIRQLTLVVAYLFKLVRWLLKMEWCPEG